MSKKREKRAMNRIQKRKAEIELLGEDDEKQNAKKRALMTESDPAPSTSSAELARELSKELKEHRSQHSKKERFDSQLQLHKLNGKTLSERELAAFMHRHMLGAFNTESTQMDTKWVRFDGGRKPLQIVMIRVNCQDPEMMNTQPDAKFIDSYFDNKWVRLHWSVRDRRQFWQSLSIATQSRRELLMRKIKESGDPLLAMRVPERKAQLLMSLEELTQSRYPFPTEVFEEAKHGGEPPIRATRSIYRRVSASSPVLVLDCEMCFTSVDRLELTRISVVNEAGETLMDELVKPHNKIVNYLTHKSGITEEMLKNVHTHLKDIQQRLCALITEDTILCGHSLENDLMALQLSHPFCIDTSLLFNFAGRLHIRSSLRALSRIFLNEDIQDSPAGHCSLQDAMATLKLLKLKLDKGLIFGNVALGWNFAEWAAANGMTILGTRIRDIEVVRNEKCTETRETDKEESTVSMLEISSSIIEESVVIEKEMDGEKSKGKEESINTSEKPEKDERSCEDERVKDEEDKSQNSTAAEGTAPELFNFSDAVRIDNAMQRTASLSECFQMVHSGKRAKKMLVAMPRANEYFEANECCTLMDLAVRNSETSESGEHPSPSLGAKCAKIGAQLINYDFAFVELDCPKEMPKRELDAAFEQFIDGVCNNGYVLLIMVGADGPEGRTKDSKAIMYQRVHRKPKISPEKQGEEKKDDRS